MVATGLGFESGSAARARAAIGCDPVAELRIAANEASTRAVSVVPLIMPFSIYQKSHTNTFCRCPLCFLAAPGSGQLHACLLGYSFKRDIQRHFVADTGCILAGIKLCTLDDRGRVGANGVFLQHGVRALVRSEEHTSELQSLMRISYAVFCLKKKINKTHIYVITIIII